MYPLQNENHIKIQKHGGGQKLSQDRKGRGLVSRARVLKFFPYIMITALTIAAVFLGINYYQLREDYNAESEEYDEITDAVKTFINIDDEEEVRVAKITDVEQLREQNPQFYNEAKNGQYLVVLPETQRVLIYDKETGKIVNFSSYNIEVDVIPESQISDSEKPLTIEIRVSKDSIQGVGAEVESQLEELSSNYQIIKQSTTLNSYRGITLVLLKNASKPSMSQNITAHVGTTSISEKLPDGEEGSTADVVIIIGSDVQTIK